MELRKRVYVAGPLTNGMSNIRLFNVWRNILRAAAVGLRLLNLGYAPLVPHLTAWIPGAMKASYEAWLETDFSWIYVADGLLRLPGTSSGADREVVFANEHGIPVFHSVEELQAHVWETRAA